MPGINVGSSLTLTKTKSVKDWKQKQFRNTLLF